MNINQSVTVGVLHAHNYAGEYLVQTRIGSSGELVFTNPAGTAQLNVSDGAGTLGFRLQAVCVLQQDVYINNNTLLSTQFVPTDFRGSAAIHKAGAGTWQLGGPQTNYSGTIHIEGGQLHLRAPSGMTDRTIALTNAAVHVHTGASLVVRENVSVFADLTFESGCSLILSWANGEKNRFAGDISINNTTYGTVVFTSNNKLLPPEYLGDVRGTGRLVLDGPTVTNLFLGSLSPGASVGILTLVRNTSAANFLGVPGDLLTLNIDIAGVQGVPGIDYDQLVVSNFNNAVDLSTIDLHVTGSGTPDTTNWILVCRGSALVNGSQFNSTNCPPGLIMDVIYDYAANQVGVTLVPEPAALALLALCALRVARHRA
jgi:autotransporter-associated beta strand protein